MLTKRVSLPFSFNTHTGLLMGVQIYPKLCQKLPMKKFVNATKQVVKREITQKCHFVVIVVIAHSTRTDTTRSSSSREREHSIPHRKHSHTHSHSLAAFWHSVLY